jgi:hypothetical protein
MLPHGVASEVEISLIPFDQISFNLELWRQFLGGPKKKSHTKGGIFCS